MLANKCADVSPIVSGGRRDKTEGGAGARKPRRLEPAGWRPRGRLKRRLMGAVKEEVRFVAGYN